MEVKDAMCEEVLACRMACILSNDGGFPPPLMIPIFEISAINCDVFSQPRPVSGSLREANYLSVECFHVRHLVANECIVTPSCGFSQLLVFVVTSFLGSSEEWRVEGEAGLSKHILSMLPCHCGGGSRPVTAIMHARKQNKNSPRYKQTLHTILFIPILMSTNKKLAMFFSNGSTLFLWKNWRLFSQILIHRLV